jgi:MFS superfamily sulfate permease-like transporter
VIQQVNRPHSAELGCIQGTHIYRNLRRYPNALTIPNTIIFRFDGPLTFIASSHFRNQIISRVYTRQPQNLIIDCSGMNHVDMTGAETLEEIKKLCVQQGCQLMLYNLKGTIRDFLMRNGTVEKIAEENIFLQIQDAAQSVLSKQSARTVLKH